MFGNPETTSGGLALKFYSSVRLDIRKITSVKEGEETVGSRTRVKVVKNKVAPPFKQAEFDLMHDRGISREGDLLDLAIEDKLVDKSGSWINYGELRLGQGRENAKQYLRENPALMDELTQKILAKRGLTGMATPVGNLPAPSTNGTVHDSTPKAEAPKKRQPVAVD
jgi:recombination protein RecA